MQRELAHRIQRGFVQRQRQLFQLRRIDALGLVCFRLRLTIKRALWSTEDFWQDYQQPTTQEAI